MTKSVRLGYNGTLHEGGPQWQLLGNGYRAYDPALMRFHSADSMSPFGRGGINAYAYCGNDAINRADPSGHFIQYLPGMLAAAAALGAVTGAILSKDSETKGALGAVGAAFTIAAVGALAMAQPSVRAWLSNKHRQRQPTPTSSPTPTLRARAPSETPSQLDARLRRAQREMLGYDAHYVRDHFSYMHQLAEDARAWPASGSMRSTGNNSSRTGQLPDLITSHTPRTHARQNSLPQEFGSMRRTLSEADLRHIQPMSREQLPIRARADYVHPRRRAWSMRRDGWS